MNTEPTRLTPPSIELALREFNRPATVWELANRLRVSVSEVCEQLDSMPNAERTKAGTWRMKK